GVPVVATAARYGEGLPELMQAISEVAAGEVAAKPHRVGGRSPVLERAVARLTEAVRRLHPSLPNAQWVALRLLDGDEKLARAFADGELGALDGGAAPSAAETPAAPAPGAEAVLRLASTLRWQVGPDFHQALMETIYTEAARLADRAVTRSGEKRRFDFDRTLDRLVTSRRWGIPIM